MQLINSVEFARSADAKDPLRLLRDDFFLPRHQEGDAIYFCGNSLGLQPRRAKESLGNQLENWHLKGVEGWFDGPDPWLSCHEQVRGLLAPIVGATAQEVVAMNSLSVNLHLMMVSFYRPSAKRYKILIEAGAFPSDQYIVDSQVRFHGFDPTAAVIEVHPQPGEELLRTEDILACIREHQDELALVLFSGINYYTGQLFEIETITRAAHQAGAFAGFDLAHAAGNVPLNLHHWKVDFACWCSYKYMNSGPGGIGGAFIHEKHFDQDLPRLEGWWGNHPGNRFKMERKFVAAPGADRWQLSTSPILLLALHQAALKLFEKAGGMAPLRQKSTQLTAYLEFILHEVNRETGKAHFRIITPADPAIRGCQLSVVARENGRSLFQALVERGIIGDWREPDVIRVSPVPLYNTFEEVYLFGKHLMEIIQRQN